MKWTTSSPRLAWIRQGPHFSDYLKLGEYLILQWLSPEGWKNQLCIWKIGTREDLINDALDKLWTYDLAFPGRSWRLVRGGSTVKVILTFKG